MTRKSLSREPEPGTTSTAGKLPLLESALAAMADALTLARYRWAAPLVAGRRVLDVGCGVGRGAAILMGQGAAEVVAVDETAAVVEVARSEAPPGVQTQRADLDRLPFQQAAFDIVVSLSAKQPDGTGLVAELLRVVKPEGLLVVSVHAEAITRIRDLLSEQRRHVAVADQRELAGSELRWETAAREQPEGTLVRQVSVLDGNRPSGEPPGSTILLASDVPIPSLGPVAVAFDLGSVDKWLAYSTEQERRIEELESRIGELEAQMRDRDQLRRELRATEQTLAMRISSYEEAVQNASVRTAERYVNTVSWKLTSPLRRSKPKVKRLVRRLVRSAL